MIEKLYIHPIAILGVVQKKNSLAYIENRKRIIGCLLGYTKNNKKSCTSSFHIPFEEEIAENSWFIDHNFIEKMADMYKKVNTKESVIGWYSNSKKINNNDININKLFWAYIENPIQVLIWTNEKGLFIDAFISKNNFRINQFSLLNINVVIGMLESEEIGIFHILKNSSSVRNLIVNDSINDCFRIFRFYIIHINKFIKKKKNKLFKSDYTNLIEFQSTLDKILPILNRYYFIKKTKKNFFWFISSLLKNFIDNEKNFIILLKKY